VKVRGIGREPEQFRIGHLHATVELVFVLAPSGPCDVKTRLEAHFTRHFSQLVYNIAHGFESVRRRARIPRRREHYQPLNAEL
jgi:hypothetical protein